MFGLSVHFKIYPIIYDIPIFFFINRTKGVIWNWELLISIWVIFNLNWLKFFLSSAFMFFSLLLLFYSLYGYRFVYETYIYHSERVDHRHNFSFNYYFEYLYYLDLPLAILSCMILRLDFIVWHGWPTRSRILLWFVLCIVYVLANIFYGI